MNNVEGMPDEKKTDVQHIFNRYLSDIGISHVVELRDYNPLYKEIFLVEKKRLLSAFNDMSIALHHVGSTSVEGLCSKPIIDMLLTHPKGLDLEMLKRVLVDSGYRFRDDLFPERTYFVLEDDHGVRYCSITVQEEGDSRSKEILKFRDNLRNSPALTKEYANIKREISSETADRMEYAYRKSEFIQRHSQ
jgi:GrpB-like predicted nucleotidyltransferase (UPF0157 family)